jgi:hypothetical protein
MKIKLSTVGLLIGGVVGFLLRPSVPLMGQLSFSTVITRGANLHGLDQLLVGYARTSLNYLIAGTLLGAVIGLIAAVFMSSQSQTSERTKPLRPPS